MKINAQAMADAFDKHGGRPTYAELGEQLGCNANTARLYYLGLVTRPSYEMLVAFAELLGVEVSDLVVEDEKRGLQPIRAGATLSSLGVNGS